MFRRAMGSNHAAALTLLATLCVPIHAQDPLKTLPDSYKLELENAHVKVVRVHYAPHAKLPAHDHPAGPTAYVYLNDGGPVVFKHIGLSYGEITRPATVAGSVRLGRPVEEIHEVENPNDAPSDFLRVEFKQLPAEAREIRGRFRPEPTPPGEIAATVLFENTALRLTRRTCAPQKACDLSASAEYPLVLISLANGRVTPVGKAEIEVVAGQASWLDPETRHVFEARGERALGFLTFELKNVAAPAPAAEKGLPR